MSRYRAYGNNDDQPMPDGDAGFVAVDERRDPRQLSQGLVSRAVNKVFTNGAAATRGGFQTVGWAGELAVDFPLNFRVDGYSFYDLFSADASCLDGLSFRVYNGDTFQLFNEDAGTWHTVWIQMLGATATLMLDTVGMSGWVYRAEQAVADRNYRLWMGRTFQLLCPSTGLWHTVWISDLASSKVIKVDQTGVTTGATYAPVGDANWLVRGGSFCLICPDNPYPFTSTWHQIWVRVVQGAPVLTIDATGVDETPDTDELGVNFDQKIGLGTVYGRCEFADPFGQEGVLLATRYGVYCIRQNQQPQMIYLPDQEEITEACHFVQCFDRVVLLRGEDFENLQWTPRQTLEGGLGSFEAFDAPVTGDGTLAMPNAGYGFAMGNRLFVVVDDEVYASDILDYGVYDPTLSPFTVNAGTSDRIRACVPFNQNTVIVFKGKSIYYLAGVVGDLSTVSQDVLTREYGIVGREAWFQTGNDIWFFSEAGVFSIQQALDNKLQAKADSISAPLDPVVRRINWSVSGAIRGAIHDNRGYFAVPMDGSRYNNVLLVYDFINDGWAGYWTSGWLDVLHFFRTSYAGKRCLMFVNATNLAEAKAFGAVLRVEAGVTDFLWDEDAQIEDELLTRGYAMNVLEQKRYGRFNVDLATWNPSFTVSSRVDGVAEEATLGTNLTKSRTRYYTHGVAPWVQTNENDDHVTAYRQDYSVMLGPDGAEEISVGSGMQIAQEQRITQPYRIGRRGIWAQLRIRNNQGRMTIFGVLPEAIAGARSFGVKV